MNNFKKIVLVVAAMVAIGSVNGQNKVAKELIVPTLKVNGEHYDRIFGTPQPEKYYKVQIADGEKITRTLLQLGITIDHSDIEDGGLVAEISESELNVLKQNNIKHTVLISDVAKFYEERNKMSANKPSMVPLCNDQNITKPTYFHLGSMGGYFTFNEITQILDSMALLYPNLITVKQGLSPLTHQGRTIWYVKISDNPNADESEPEVFYNSVHHAREAASVSQLIYYMWYLLENYSTNPDIKATVDATELYFVPCVNPDGYVYNQTISPNGGGMWRKNRRNNGGGTYGVDLNRNYGYNWGYDNTGSSPTASSDTYRGPSAFSEPETQAIRDFCNTRQFVSCLNAHTYGNLLIYPWGYLPSIYTPDSATFVNWSVLLTENSRFLYGTGDQTVNYVTNGDSDDWMYGEQGTKPKILALTPEAGASGDGFWPASNRILDICKTTFTQNYNLARIAAKYAIARDWQDKFLGNTGYLKYKIQRLGLTAGAFTVNVTPLGAEFLSVGAPKVYPSLTQNQEVLDSISYILNGGLTPGQTLKYLIGVNNGSHTYNDTISKVYGTPVILLADAGNTVAANFTTSGSWGLSTTKYYSPPSSITESPAGNYSSNSTKSITTTAAISLTNAVYAHLQYYTRFELEKNNDKVEILVSTNNGASWSPLCGRYETAPASFGGTNPVYDGIQNGWVKEDINISNYIGLSVKFAFKFSTNFNVNKDGFYFDDFLVRKLVPGSTPPTGLNSGIILTGNIVLSPNPSSGLFNLYNPEEKDLTIKVYNLMGQVIVKENGTNAVNSKIDLGEQPNGIYFVKVKYDGIEEVKKLVKE